MRYGLLVLFVAVPLLGASQHAPTLEQCHADAIMWKSQANPDQATVTDLWQRQQELIQCANSDPANYATYMQMADAAQNIAYMRMMSFLQRHKLMQQFVDEDKKGMR